MITTRALRQSLQHTGLPQAGSTSSSRIPFSILELPIQIPPLRPRAPHFKVPFFKLRSHTIPVKWSLYRQLLRSTPDERHREAVKKRWRGARFRYCTSPLLTLKLMRKEEEYLADYLAVKEALRLSNAHKGDSDEITAGDHGNSNDTSTALSRVRTSSAEQYPIDNSYTDDPESTTTTTRTIATAAPSEGEDQLFHLMPRPTSYSRLPGLQHDIGERIAKLEESLEKLDLKEQTDRTALEEYKLGLEQAAPTLRPILTPGLLFPSFLNPGLPRLKPQPLHITMPITHRQKARDKRIIQLKAWKEMMFHLKMEPDFGGSKSDMPFEYVSSVISALKASDQRDFGRITSKFPIEMLQARDEARRRRPGVLTAQRRRKDLAARLEQIQAQAEPNEKDDDDLSGNKR